MIDLEMLVIADFLLFVYLSFESTTTKPTPTLGMDAAWLDRRWQPVRIIQHSARHTWRLAFVLMMEGSCD